MDYASVMKWFPYAMLVASFMAAALAGVLIVALAIRKENNTAFRILIAVLLLAVTNQFLLLARATRFDLGSQFLIRLSFPISLFSYGLLYLHLQKVASQSATFRRPDLWALAPGAVGLIWYFIPQFFGLTILFEEGPVLFWERYLRTVVGVVVMSVFLYLAFRIIRKFEREIPDVSARRDELSLRWLRTILFTASLLLAMGIADVMTGPYYPLWMLDPVLVTFSIALLTICALRESQVFTEISRLHTPTREGFLSSDQISQGKIPLERLFEVERIYLNPNLRLSDVATSLKIKSYQVSEILNRGFGMSFFDYVNRQRIEEAKRRLVDPQYSHLNILGIAMDCGFNSKSSFAEAFRRWAGTTPSAYRNQASRPSVSPESGRDKVD
jgi:AraC-like DNA-binding protein